MSEGHAYRLRAVLHEGRLLVVRDVLFGDRFVRCEAAYLVSGRLAWVPCQEGSEFVDLPAVACEAP
ncbi:MAG: hypothetical protein K2X54_31700 [Methylobacterium organophilum]|nr:hypothetical protein [Methylobacterium organophilum]